MKSVKGKTALVTGASSGIGAAFAWQLAEKGCHLIITARSKDRLEMTAQSIRQKYGVRVTVHAADLSDEQEPHLLYNKVIEDRLQVDLLINNAGFGKWANFLDEPLPIYEEMMEVNMASLVKLTYLFLPQMLTKGEGGIINIGSTGSFQPCPYVALYCATKAFVLNFSEALYGEYAQKGIIVTAVCPGNTTTGFFDIARANTKGMSFDPPERVAKDGLEALLKGRNYTVIGRSNYWQSLSSRFFTRKMIIRITGNMFNKKVNGR